MSVRRLVLPPAHPFAARRSVECHDAPCEQLFGTEGYVEACGTLMHDEVMHGVPFPAGSFVASDPEVSSVHVRLHAPHVVLGHALPTGACVTLRGEQL